MLSIIRRYLIIINETASSFCFRRMKKNGYSYIIRGKNQLLLLSP